MDHRFQPVRVAKERLECQLSNPAAFSFLESHSIPRKGNIIEINITAKNSTCTEQPSGKITWTDSRAVYMIFIYA